MNIILFTNERGQVWNFSINLLHVSLSIVAALVLLLGAAVYTGIQMGNDELKYLAGWQEAVDEQQAEIAAARQNVQNDIDALTLRIGQMQAQLLRLNALGGRLVSQGDLDQEEFNFNALPAVGGPQNLDSHESVPLAGFLDMLDAVEIELADREQKLSVLENVLMNRSLSERVMPSGRPVAEGWLSSRYGKRNDPFSGKQDFHKGLDFAGKKGSPVLAVADGVVSQAGKNSGYGQLIEINHGNGYSTRYGHNEANLVAVGDTVKKGQKIALMGSTGRSTGPHVHFEVLRNGKTVNPAQFIAE